MKIETSHLGNSAQVVQVSFSRVVGGATADEKKSNTNAIFSFVFVACNPFRCTTSLYTESPGAKQKKSVLFNFFTFDVPSAVLATTRFISRGLQRPLSSWKTYLILGVFSLRCFCVGPIIIDTAVLQ